MPMGALPSKKKKTAEKKLEESEEHSVPQQRVAMFPMPGMPSVRSPEQEDKRLAVEKEDEGSNPVTGSYTADEVPDMEDVTPQPVQQTPTSERPPPIPSDSKFFIPRKRLEYFTRPTLECFHLSSSEMVTKSYVASDGCSEYLMTVSVSSMFGGVAQYPIFATTMARC
jgi:hypothetical protein